MFDWWERMFDYTTARAEVRRRCERTLWHLFEEAQAKQPADPGYLLRHLGADARHWPLELRYFQGQNVPVYAVTSTDLEDERWTLRAWHADRWLRALQHRSTAKDIAGARPDLWACDDPSAELSGESQTGQANLLAFVSDGCLNNDEPRRYEELRRLNDGLRDRGRRALVAYLCHMNRVALPWQPGQFATSAADLSDLLLLDVEAGLCEKASRIEEAITAVQSFVRRSQLGLEPGWTVTREFARLWDSRFETYRTWERCKRRELYRENWIEWDELAKARRIEAFRFLESRAAQLHPHPGGAGRTGLVGGRRHHHGTRARTPATTGSCRTPDAGTASPAVHGGDPGGVRHARHSRVRRPADLASGGAAGQHARRDHHDAGRSGRAGAGRSGRPHDSRCPDRSRSAHRPGTGPGGGHGRRPTAAAAAVDGVGDEAGN